MHSFITTIFHLLTRAAGPALLAAAIAGALLALFCWKRRRAGQPLPGWRIAAIALLVCYLGGLAAVTLLLRLGGGMRTGIQTRLFLAFWEAWNAFTLQAWLNPLLNIAMFIPLGVLLPLAFPRFRRWNLTLAAGLAVSLAIETLQFLTGRGQADVDDLFCNVLGAMLGFCLCLIALNLWDWRWKAAAPYTAFPALFAAVFVGTFAAYHLQPYGNLADGPIPVLPADTSQTEWVLDCALSSEPGPAGVYWAEPFTRETCDQFALNFAQRRGVDITSDRFDIDYYDNTAYYSDHSTFCIIVNYNDRSYEYNDYRVDGWGEGNWDAITEAELRADLDELGIPVPQAAQFFDEGNGKYVFRAANAEEDGVFYDGALECQVAKGGALYQVDNTMSASALHGEAPVISQQEAYARLRAGRFSRREAFSFGETAPGEVHVTACALEYLTDSKGFRQPVYYFTLSDNKDAARGGNGWRTFVPALA